MQVRKLWDVYSFLSDLGRDEDDEDDTFKGMAVAVLEVLIGAGKVGVRPIKGNASGDTEVFLLTEEDDEEEPIH